LFIPLIDYLFRALALAVMPRSWLVRKPMRPGPLWDRSLGHPFKFFEYQREGLVMVSHPGGQFIDSLGQRLVGVQDMSEADKGVNNNQAGRDRLVRI
jgi:hypothetical protein